jgi:UDP-glucose:(heptosyl)LPS alpha-1,3-glucosyltransferase
MEEADIYWPHGGLHAATLAAGESSKGGVGGTISRALHRISPKHRAFVGLEDRLFAARRARAVWCVSQLVRDEIAARYPQTADLLEVHANGVDLERFHPRLRRERRNAFLARHGADPAHPVILFLGGNWRLKGFDVLAAALRDVPPPWTLIAAGNGHGRVQAAEIAAGGGRVVVLPQQDARDLFGAADLLVQPTFRDPCSLATLEALASGVPVITTRENGAADAVTQDLAGTVIDAPDAALLAPAIRHWLQTVGVEAVRTTEVAVEARRAAERRPIGTWLDGLTASLRRLAAST